MGGEITETAATKLKSITLKWLVNVLPFILLVVVLCEILAGTLLFNYYEDLAMSAAMDCVDDINVLSLSDASGFAAASRSYVQNFSHRDKVEVQIFDNEGTMIVTTNGFAVGGISDDATDYSEAVTKNAEATWYGKNANGERVLATTCILPDLGFGSNGAYRVVVSMENVMTAYYTMLSGAIVIGFVTIVLSVASGVFFIRSIVRPVRDVSATARKIAGGEMNARLEVKRNDEIGDLCESVNYMASKLQNADKLKNDFISSVSHELRTPLTAIRGWGETVRTSVGEDDEVVRHGIDVMLDESTRLSGLVEELLDFSRMESGKFSMTPTLCDPQEIVASVIDMYEEIANRKKVSLVFVKQQSSAGIMADRDRIKQVFINIIDNAVKYTDAGGHVVVSAINEEGCIRFTIGDTGCGIPKKDLDHVKEKFYKANSKVRGSGIGLAVADEIIKHHNGLLFVESTEGEGTTVTVVLPTVKSQPEELTEVIFPPAEGKEEPNK